MTKDEAIMEIKECIDACCCEEVDKEAFMMAISALEQPERKKGQWLPDNNCYHTPHFICSACGVSQEVDTVMYKPSWAFCPLCGADMRGDQ